MAWKVAAVVALLTAFATAIVSVIVATYVAERYGVSDREGARSMSIFFFLAPMAFAVGLLFGLLATYYVGATTWAQFWTAMGASMGLSSVAILAMAGYFLLSAPSIPKAAVFPFVVQVEVSIPLDRISAHPEEHAPMQMTLEPGLSENISVVIDTTLTRQEDGWRIVTGVADLDSASASSVLSFFLDESNWMQLVDLPLMPPTKGTDPTWSERMPLHDMLSEQPHNTPVEARVRVAKRELEK